MTIDLSGCFFFFFSPVSALVDTKPLPGSKYNLFNNYIVAQAEQDCGGAGFHFMVFQMFTG